MEGKDLSETETETPEQDAPDTEEPTETESENPDEEQDEQIEGSDEDQTDEQAEEPAEPSSFKLTDEQDKALEKERKSHETKIKNIVGSAWEDMISCPVCQPQMGGYLYDEDLMKPDTAERQAIHDLYSPAPTVTYRQDPGTKMCDRCDGEGETLTGSKNPRYLKIACSNCNGFGYYPPPGVASNGAFTPTQTSQLVAVAAGDAPQEDMDAFGHPRFLHDGRENPNFGRMPQFIDPNYP